MSVTVFLIDISVEGKGTRHTTSTPRDRLLSFNDCRDLTRSSLTYTSWKVQEKQFFLKLLRGALSIDTSKLELIKRNNLICLHNNGIYSLCLVRYDDTGVFPRIAKLYRHECYAEIAIIKQNCFRLAKCFRFQIYQNSFRSFDELFMDRGMFVNDI